SGGFAAAVSAAAAPAAASTTAAVRASRARRRGTTPTVLRRDEASANARYVVSGAHVLRQRLAAADSGPVRCGCVARRPRARRRRREPLRRVRGDPGRAG